MRHYWALDRIARRMGVHPRTLCRMIRRGDNLPIYQRWAAHTKLLVWYSNEALIQRWELEQVEANRIQRRQKSRSRKPTAVHA